MADMEYSLEAARDLTWTGPVAMTANAMQSNREECLAAGMDDYGTKPIRVDALVEALNQVVARMGP